MIAELSRPLRATEVQGRTTLGVFLRQSDRLADRTLVRFYDPAASAWTPLSWTAFRHRVMRVAQGLIDGGIKAGDRVLLLSENRVEWLFCDLGIQAAGAITVPVYASLVPASVHVIADDSGAVAAIVSDPRQAAKLSEASHLNVFSMAVEVPRWVAGDAPMSTELADRLRTLRPDDVATIAYTSGTSGRPKGAVITHGIVVDEIESYRKAYDIGPDDVILSVLPYAHIFERIAAFYFATILCGAELDVSRGPERVLDDIRALRPTCMEAVPRLFEKVTQELQARLARRSPIARAVFAWSMRSARATVDIRHPGWALRLRHGLADRFVLRSIRDQITGGRLRFFLSGSAPLLPEIEEFFWALGIPIYQGWGMTELTCAATCNTVSDHRFGTVGKALPGVEVRLAPDGEIEVRGPGLMKEYYGNPAATLETMSGGWLHTGDIGRIDADGFLTITDRKKDLIKTSGGKYVAPQPIEVKLRQDPHIQSAVVVGDGRKYVTALIVPDWPLITRELGLVVAPPQLVNDPRVLSIIKRKVDEVNSGLDRFETVKYFRLLPRPLTVEADEVTPTLKVKRRVVADHYRDLIDGMYLQTRDSSAQTPAGSGV